MNPGSSSRWLKSATILALFMLCGSLRAQTTLGLTAPASYVSPNADFYVELWVNATGEISIGQYEIAISYNPDVLEIIEVEPGTAAAYSLDTPVLLVNPMSNDFTVFDSLWGTTASCTYYTGTYSLAKIKMRVKTTAPLGEASTLSILPLGTGNYYLYDCVSKTGITIGGTVPDNVMVVPYLAKTYDLQQYLDVDADYAIGEGDVDFFSEIINKYRYNVGGTYQVKLGGIQMDFRGNARPDAYDLGSADAVARPTRFVRSGTNGICQSTAASTDVQEIAVGQGYRYAIAILPGPNNVLNTTPGGDDTITGMVITTGANGICETTKAGDDVQTIAVGNGQANQICVSPGADGKLSTTLIGDDTSLEQAKPIAQILTYDYLTPGRPKWIRVVYPPPKGDGSSLIYFPKATTTALLVKVIDSFHNPKPGISPTFTVIQGGARFIYNGLQYTIFEGQPADQFLTLGNAPAGAVGGLIDVPRGESTIKATVAADPAKGITSTITENVYINCVLSNPPATLQLEILEGGDLGIPLQTQITALDYLLQPSPGHARRIKLMTDRNLANGCLGSFGADCGDPVVADNFEKGMASWTVSDPSIISVVPYPGSWLGGGVVRAANSMIGSASMTTTVNAAGFINKKMKLSFQWRYQGTLKGKLEVLYRLPGLSWVNLRAIHREQLSKGMNNFVWEEIDLSSIFYKYDSCELMFLFTLYPDEIFYLDNFAVAGFKSILNEKFDTETVGNFPINMDYSNYINAGSIGMNGAFVPAGDDVARFPYKQGEPNQEAIWPGVNKVLDTTPADDDTVAVINGNTVITTGANGVCKTNATGDDYQLIPYNQGKPHVRTILPGANRILETIVPKDNEGVNPIGPSPYIMVYTGGAEGTSKSVIISRSAPTGTMNDYAFEKRLDLAGYKSVFLSFYTKTLGMAQSTNPKPQFICEVSDDGAHTWVPVWDFEGVDHDWTWHEIPLHNDPRFSLVNGFIIRWRASLEQKYTGQAAYVDQIRVYGANGEPDVITVRTYDSFTEGDYGAAMTFYTQSELMLMLAALYMPEMINYTTAPYDLPIISDPISFKPTALQVDPRTVKVVPENFSLNACERLNYKVIGKKAGEFKYSDLTDLYRLEVHGPGRMVTPGVFEAECFIDTATARPKFFIRAIPLVSNLEDPTFSGTAVQTGLVSGKIFLPNLQSAATASVEVLIPGSGSIYGVANSTGNYIFGAVPTGTNYTVNALKTGYMLNYKSSVPVSSGTNTTVNIILKNSADCDGDGTLDSADIDDDDDGLADNLESVKGTLKCKLDSDGDGWGDGDDLFPADGTEWRDSDNDGIGDGDETDDDADSFTDSEESGLGVDGFITNGQDPDTDHDGYTDYVEYSNSTDPTVYTSGAADTDLDGLFDSQEQGGGGCGVSWNKVNSKTNYNNTDTDGDSLNDYAEVYSYNTNPSCADTDLDGLSDLAEGSTAIVKPCPYANNPDSDGDGLCDGNTAVSDGSTVVCLNGEVTAGASACNPDSDGDQMPDGWEVQYGLTPTVANATADPDNDTLNNLTEYINNANPFNPDTDDDGILDGEEVANGLNPAVPNWGTINVSSDPTGAKVYLDGTQVYRGQYAGLSGTAGSPLSIGTLKNEKHTITIVANNYFICHSVVNVTLGQTFVVNPTLAWRKYEVFTTSTPVMANGHTVTASYASPHAVDFDRNGTMDLFLGASGGTLNYYSNSSTNSLSLAAAVAVQAASTVLDVGERAKPFVVDWNNDNQLDLVIGNSTGYVYYYAGNGSTNFSAGVQIQAGGTALDVGSYAAPFVVDWDGDNRKDLVVGNSSGYFYLCLNSGTDAAPVFSSGTALVDVDGVTIDTGSYATPIIYDVFRHGYLALGFGNYDGNIGGCGYGPSDSGYHCMNPFLSTTYSDVTTTIDVGNYAAASIADVNGDKQLDMFVGNSANSLVYYQSSHLVGDIDRSTKVDAGDWIQIKQSMGLCKGNGGYNPGSDLNGDNCVTSADLTVLMGNFGKTY